MPLKQVKCDQIEVHPEEVKSYKLVSGGENPTDLGKLDISMDKGVLKISVDLHAGINLSSDFVKGQVAIERRGK